MKTAYSVHHGHDVELTVRPTDFVHRNGVARWTIPGDDEAAGNPVGAWVHQERPEIESALQDAVVDGEASGDSIQVLAVELAVWRLHNRRDRSPYPVVKDDGDLCVMITEQQLAEIIDEANKIIKVL